MIDCRRYLHSTSAPRRVAVAVALLAIILGGLSAARAVDFAVLARRVPADANAVVAVDCKALFASPLAKSAGWRERYADAFESAPLLIPPTADRGLVAASFDLETMRPSWQAAILAASIDPTVEEIASRRGGTVDRIAGLGAVWLGGKACVVKFAAGEFGVLQPANRQSAVRWATAAGKPSEASVLSPYLQRVLAAREGTAAQLTLAIDLTGAFRESDIRGAAAKSAVLASANLNQAVAALAATEGVTLSVTVADKIYGRLQLDVAEGADALAPIAKPLILAILSKSGAMLDEFSNWSAGKTTQGIAIQGELTAEGMHRLFSLLTLDAAVLAADSPDNVSSAPSAAAASPTAGAGQAQTFAPTRRYFREVGKYVDDAQRLNRADSLGQAVFWIQNYSRRVAAISTRGVDADIVQYGQYVAQTFDAITQQAAGLQDRVAQAEAQADPAANMRIGFLPTGRTVNYGGDLRRMYVPYGTSQIDPAEVARQQQRSEDDVHQSVEQARETISALIADHQKMRAELERRYGQKF